VLINKTIETPQGTVKFEGELEAQELDLVLKIGLNYLLQQGALPFTFADEIGEADENNIQ
jgi:ABC-type proline/glycine betaine transport system ATPase subunit